MKKTKRLAALLLAAMMLLSLCGCGSAHSGSAAKSDGMPVPEPAVSYNGYYSDMEMAAEEAYDGDYGVSAVAMTAGAGSSSNSGSSGSGSDVPEENPDKIIYSSDVTVETTDFDTSIAKVNTLVETYGGWIESSSVSGSNYYQKARGTASTRDASFTLRIPGNRFSALMENLTELGNVPYSHIYTENVTSQYYDAQAHLKAYQTQENRLLEMMELAETVEDVIIIEDRLTELRYQIEAIQSRLNNWDRRVSYSTVYLTVKEVREYTPEEKVNPTYGEELLQALKDGLRNAGEFLKNLLVFLVEAIPVLVILVPIVWLLVWLIRKIFRGSGARAARRREKREAKKAAKEAVKEAKKAAAEGKKTELPAEARKPEAPEETREDSPRS